MDLRKGGNTTRDSAKGLFDRNREKRMGKAQVREDSNKMNLETCENSVRVLSGGEGGIS